MDRITELEKLIGKTCDLIDPMTNKIWCYEVFIVGVCIISGYPGLMHKQKRHLKKELIYYKNFIDNPNGTETIKACVKDIRNVRDCRKIKVEPHHLIVKMCGYWSKK